MSCCMLCSTAKESGKLPDVLCLSQMEGGMDAGKGSISAAAPEKEAVDSLPREISLSSEADDMIAAWKGGRDSFDDGNDASAAPHADEQHSLQAVLADGEDAAPEVRVQPCAFTTWSTT